MGPRVKYLVYREYVSLLSVQVQFGVIRCISNSTLYLSLVKLQSQPRPWTNAEFKFSFHNFRRADPPTAAHGRLRHRHPRPHPLEFFPLCCLTKSSTQYSYPNVPFMALHHGMKFEPVVWLSIKRISEYSWFMKKNFYRKYTHKYGKPIPTFH